MDLPSVLYIPLAHPPRKRTAPEPDSRDAKGNPELARPASYISLYYREPRILDMGAHGGLAAWLFAVLELTRIWAHSHG